MVSQHIYLIALPLTPPLNLAPTRSPFNVANETARNFRSLTGTSWPTSLPRGRRRQARSRWCPGPRLLPPPLPLRRRRSYRALCTTASGQSETRSLSVSSNTFAGEKGVLNLPYVDFRSCWLSLRLLLSLLGRSRSRRGGGVEGPRGIVLGLISRAPGGASSVGRVS